MADDKDRRFLDRVKIDGARVAFRASSEKGLFNRFSDPMPVEDITWSSVRFSTNHFLKTGDTVDLEVLIPGENKIKVKGYLVWTSRKPDDQTNYAVVQLMPFGSGKQYNSLNIRQKLKVLIKKYSKLPH
jgi:hypothetical protein